jgi:hypothetical protein
MQRWKDRQEPLQAASAFIASIDEDKLGLVSDYQTLLSENPGVSVDIPDMTMSYTERLRLDPADPDSIRVATRRQLQLQRARLAMLNSAVPNVTVDPLPSLPSVSLGDRYREMMADAQEDYVAPARTEYAQALEDVGIKGIIRGSTRPWDQIDFGNGVLVPMSRLGTATKYAPAILAKRNMDARIESASRHRYDLLLGREPGQIAVDRTASMAIESAIQRSDADVTRQLKSLRGAAKEARAQALQLGNDAMVQAESRRQAMIRAVTLDITRKQRMLSQSLAGQARTGFGD